MQRQIQAEQGRSRSCCRRLLTAVACASGLSLSLWLAPAGQVAGGVVGLAQAATASSGTAAAAENGATKVSEEKAAPQVVAIQIQGQERIEPATIFDAIQRTQVGERLQEEAVQADLRSIYELGYFSDVRAEFYETKGGVRVVFVVEEFPPVKDVVIQSPVVEAGKLRSYLSLKPGEVFNLRRFQTDVATLRQKVMDELGYVLYLQDFTIDDQGVVTVKLQPTHLASIEVKGNKKTKERVILRELSLKPGDVFQMEELRKGLRRLMLLGFFDEVTPSLREGEQPGTVVLTLEVQERKTGSATFGAGYSSADGLIGYVEVADQNFLGNGQKLNLRWEFGRQKSEYDIGFFEPYLGGTRTSFGFNLFKLSTDRDIDTYRERRVGGDISIGRALGEYTNLSGTYRLENVKIEPKPGSDVDPRDDQVRSITLTEQTDTTDNLLWPTMGYRHRLSGEFAGGILGGNVQFSKYQGEVSRYILVGKEHGQTLALRLSGGFGVSPEGHLPVHEEFRVGGAESVRGYSYGAMRGDKMLFGNLEYRFQVAKSVQGVLFVDAGNAWAREQQVRLGDMKVGAGVGVRFDTPLGIMRIDYGVGKQGGQAYFSLGPSF